MFKRSFSLASIKKTFLCFSRLLNGCESLPKNNSTGGAAVSEGQSPFLSPLQESCPWSPCPSSPTSVAPLCCSPRGSTSPTSERPAFALEAPGSTPSSGPRPPCWAGAASDPKEPGPRVLSSGTSVLQPASRTCCASSSSACCCRSWSWCTLTPESWWQSEG